MRKCPYCRELIQDDAVKCRFCGSMLVPESPNHKFDNNSCNNPSYAPGSNIPPSAPIYGNNAFDEGPEGKSRGVAALLAILLGSLGVQYFYLGKIGGGFITIALSLVSCGIWNIVTLIQGILMFCMSNEEFRRKYVISTSTFPLF